MKQNVILNALNRGLVSEEAIARVDLERLRLSAVVQNNLVPRALGSASIRPGTKFIATTRGNAVAKPIPFIYSVTDTAWIDVTYGLIRPIINDVPISRASVSTTITNGDFSSGTGWTIVDTGGATGVIASGLLTMECVAIGSYTTCTRSETIIAADQGITHGARVIINNGPVWLRIGSTSGAEDYMGATQLGTGEHSLAFTPTGATIYIQLEGREPRDTVVTSIAIEPAGEVTIASPWVQGDLQYLRWAPSGDIIYVACFGYQTRKIERRSTTSWSLVKYEPTNGPFLAVSTDDNLKLSIDKARGNATLTATRPLFKSTHVGALFRAFTAGYNFPYYLAQDEVFTPAIRINGVGAARYPSLTIAGTWAGTITVQKSFVDEFSGFTDEATTYTGNTGPTAITEASDNVAVWFRAGFKTTGDYTSGTAEITLTFGAGGSGPGTEGASVGATSTGGRSGNCRILTVTNDMSAEVEILDDFSSDQKTVFWNEGQFSDKRGHPSAVAINEGRMSFGAKDQFVASVPDAYENFSPDVDGDSGVIQRSIGYGPVQLINWLLPLGRLLIGGEASEISVKSTTFDEPLTPTNFSMKDISTFGSARQSAVKVDTSGFFVDRAKAHLMEASYEINVQDYATVDLNKITPDLNTNNPIVHIMVQRQPETRIHCIRADGTVAVLLYEKEESVLCWYTVDMGDGFVEDGFVLPADYEDAVYYIVRRVINNSTHRYYEKFALISECIGGTLSKNLDCHYEYSGSATTTIGGLSHLEAKTVWVWGNGKSLGSYTVTGGQITGLPETVSSAIVGLSYRWQFKSTKLAYAAGQGTAIGQRKRVNKIGYVAQNTHRDAISAGRDFDNLQPAPTVVKGATISADIVYDTLDMDMTEFNGDWDTDSRICLQGDAPYPASILAIYFAITTNDT